MSRALQNDFRKSGWWWFGHLGENVCIPDMMDIPLGLFRISRIIPQIYGQIYREIRIANKCSSRNLEDRNPE
jgi:hypothetical protein